MTGTSPERRHDVHIRTLLANTGEGFIVLDDGGLVQVMNEAGALMLGVDRAGSAGRPLADLGVEGLPESIDRALEPETGRRSAPSVVTTNGKTLSCRAYAFESEDGPGTALILRDDTELMAQQERAEAILAGASDGLIVFDPDSRITYVNPAAAEMLKRPPSALRGKHITLHELLGIEIPTDDDAKPCWEMLGCTRVDCPAHGAEDLRCWLRCGTPGPTGSPQRYVEKREQCLQCEVYAANGELLGEIGEGAREVEVTDPEHRVLEIRTNPVTARSGRYLGCVASIHDVTAEREVAVMKNEFVSMVSHELRTPLTSIKGYVDLVVDGDAGEINDLQREFLSIVQENSDRLVSLINDLLDISRIESGRVHLKVEPLDVAEVLRGVVYTFRTMAEQQGVDLSWQVTKSLPRAAADRDRVGQVLMNLVSNAIKYSPNGGTVTVTAKRRKEFVLIEVTDSGIGIAPEDQKQLFSKFFRVDSSLTREIGGTGLGLSICKSVVELHGGRIGARSIEGQGSTFWFTLPVAPSELIRRPEIEGPESVGGGTVLIIDRDPEIGELIGTYLSKRGYVTVHARTADEAFEAALKHEPDAITLDVILDDRDGFDLLSRLQGDPRTADIPVLVLSIVCDEGKSLRLGAADYLEKPIDQSRLTAVIDGIVGSKKSPYVLVVDDERDIVSALCRSLKRQGFAVASAFDGREAMAAIRDKHPDLVLLDLRMPVMDGYEVIEAVKSDPSTSDIPIVVMTAHRIDDDRIDLLHLAAEQIAKPLEIESLAAHVGRVLSGQG